MNKTLPCLAAIAASAAIALGQCQLERLESPAPLDYGRFGAPVRMNDRHLLILEWGTGVIHAYSQGGPGGGWTYLQRIAPSDRSFVGLALSLDGDRLIAGAPFSSLVEPEAGAAYVFDFDGDQWRETGQIAPVEPGYLWELGSAVAIRGGFGAVSDALAVWLYEETPAGWEARDRLVPPDAPPPGSAFGATLAMDDDWLFIGAPLDRSVAANGGAVYIYRRDGAGVTFVEKLLAPDVARGPRFGIPIVLNGKTLAIGGYISDRTFMGQGAVYVHEMVDERWTLQQELTHDDPVDDDYFGSSIALRGDILIAGAIRQRTTWGYGAAYIFERSAGHWNQAAKLLPDRRSFDFGSSAGTDGRAAIVGAWKAPLGPLTEAGAAYLHDLDCILCRPDLDGDGELTFFDFLAFGNLFAAGDMRADFDGSGALDLFDFLAFQNAFDAGCP